VSSTHPTERHRPAACKIQQNYNLLPHRAEFAFAFNVPAKRPLEQNKRDNKQEQAQKQAGTSTARRSCEAPNKTPGGTIPAGRNSRVSIS
jgi:hypothetical protein